MKKTLKELKEEKEKSTFTVRNFMNPLLAIDRTSKQKTSKNTEELSNVIKQHHPRTAECTFLLSTHATLTKTDDILDNFFLI